MAGTKAQNAKLFYSDDSGVSYDEVINMTTVNFPQGSKSDIDMTSLTSSAMEYDQDVPDFGSVSFSFNFDGTDATHQALVADSAASTKRQFKIELPEVGVATVTNCIFQATPTTSISASRGGKQEGTLDLRVDGTAPVAHAQTAEA